MNNFFEGNSDTGGDDDHDQVSENDNHNRVRREERMSVVCVGMTYRSDNDLLSALESHSPLQHLQKLSSGPLLNNTQKQLRAFITETMREYAMQTEKLLRAFKLYATMANQSKTESKCGSSSSYEMEQAIKFFLHNARDELEFNFEKLWNKMQTPETATNSSRLGFTANNMIKDVSSEAEATVDSDVGNSSSSFDVNNQLRVIEFAAERLETFLKTTIDEFNSCMALWMKSSGVDSLSSANKSGQAAGSSIDYGFVIKGPADGVRNLLRVTLRTLQFHIDCHKKQKSGEETTTTATTSNVMKPPPVRVPKTALKQPVAAPVASSSSSNPLFFECHLCYCKYRRLTDLNRHMLNKHPKQALPSPSPPPPPPPPLVPPQPQPTTQTQQPVQNKLLGGQKRQHQVVQQLRHELLHTNPSNVINAGQNNEDFDSEEEAVVKHFTEYGNNDDEADETEDMIDSAFSEENNSDNMSTSYGNNNNNSQANGRASIISTAASNKPPPFLYTSPLNPIRSLHESYLDSIAAKRVKTSSVETPGEAGGSYAIVRSSDRLFRNHSSTLATPLFEKPSLNEDKVRRHQCTFEVESADNRKMFCGFRSNHVSDVRRHLRERHKVYIDKVKDFVGTMDYEEAADTLAEYEATRRLRTVQLRLHKMS